MARSWFVRPRTLGGVLVLWSLALVAACQSHTTPATHATPTPTPTATVSGVPTSTPVANAQGVAYVPDGGNGVTFHGLQVVHFETTLGGLLSTPQPLIVNFSSSVGAVGLASDSSDMLAALGSGSPFTSPYVQDVYNANTGNPVPAGNLYNASALPSPVPSACPSVAPLVPTIPDVTGLAIVGTGASATGLAVGPGGAGILGLTSLTNGPPQYGCYIAYNGQPVNPPTAARANIEVGAFVLGTSTTTALVRGPSDLLSYGVNIVNTGFQLVLKAFDTTLGSGTTLRGHGAMVIDPHDTGKAIVLTPVSGSTNVTLLTGLPDAITKSATFSLPSTPRSVAITSNGEYAVVGADSGFYVFAGITSNLLTLNLPYAPTGTSMGANSPAYLGCAGQTLNVQNVTSIRQSTDTRYIVMLATAPTAGCANGYNSSVVVLPFNPTTGIPPTPAPTTTPTASASATPSPAPTSFVQNNIVTPPTGTDYLVVE